MSFSCRTMVGALLLAALTACGGGSVATLGGGIGGTGKPVVRVGTVTDTGALKVGEEPIDATTANVQISGLNATAGDIRLGMVALVRGRDVGGSITADDIVIDEVVKGRLEQKVDAVTLVVQGQTVLLDETTVWGPGISPASPDGLTIGDLLEIHGFVKSSGVVTARRVDRELSLSEFRLLGFASAVDTGGQTFDIGGQTVDYSGADLSGVPGGVPTNGQFLEVRGLNMLSGMNELVATEVEVADLDDEDDNDDTSLAGIVTAVNSPTQFVVGGIVVNTNVGTAYQGGLATDVVVGVYLEIDGALLAGVLTATVIEFQDSVRIESDVDTVGSSSFTLVGLPGLVIEVNSQTEFDGNASVLGDLQPGDHVEVRARGTGPATALATSVKEESASTDIEFQGPIAAIPVPSDPNFTILGVSVDTTGLADGDFEDASGATIGRAAFFAALVPGLVVDVRGELVGGSPVWDGVEIEEDDD